MDHLLVPRRVFSETTTTNALDLIFCGLRFIHSLVRRRLILLQSTTDGTTGIYSNHPTNDRSIDRRRIFYCVLGIIDSFIPKRAARSLKRPTVCKQSIHFILFLGFVGTRNVRRTRFLVSCGACVRTYVNNGVVVVGTASEPRWTRGETTE